MGEETKAPSRLLLGAWLNRQMTKAIPGFFNRDDRAGDQRLAAFLKNFQHSWCDRTRRLIVKAKQDHTRPGECAKSQEVGKIQVAGDDNSMFARGLFENGRVRQPFQPFLAQVAGVVAMVRRACTVLSAMPISAKHLTKDGRSAGGFLH